MTGDRGDTGDGALVTGDPSNIPGGLVVASYRGGDDWGHWRWCPCVSPVAALIVLATIRCGVGAAISAAARPRCVRGEIEIVYSVEVECHHCRISRYFKFHEVHNFTRMCDISSQQRAAGADTATGSFSV